MLQNAIFPCNLSRNGVARQVADRLQSVTCPLCNLSRNFFWLGTIAQSKLVLHVVMLFATFHGTLERRNPLQVAEVMLHVAVSSCNLQWIQKSMQALQKVESSSFLSLQAQYL